VYFHKFPYIANFEYAQAVDGRILKTSMRTFRLAVDTRDGDVYGCRPRTKGGRAALHKQDLSLERFGRKRTDDAVPCAEQGISLSLPK